MHLPDAWGYITFGASIEDVVSSDKTIPKDPTWPPRLAAMHIYYAQAEFREENGKYASSIDDLESLIKHDITDPFNIIIDLDTDGGYIAEVSGSPGTVVSVTHDRFLQNGVGNAVVLRRQQNKLSEV